MNRFVFAARVLALAFATTGCGKPFDVKAAPGFVALEKQSSYDWRATTPEGVVVAVRVVEDEDRGDLSFWARAVTLQLREVSGYALLETAEISSRDGTRGRLLKFGHDEEAKPFTYWLALFQAQGRLFVVEAGAPGDTFARAKPSVEWTLANLRVRCPGFLAPVLSSNTCNRW